MKICHITSVHRYDDIRISIKECSFLVKADFEVHLIAPNTEETSLNGIHVHGVRNPYNGRIKRAKNLTRDIYRKALDVNAEIYHFHDPELIPIGLKLRKKGKKVIYDIHEDVPRQILSKHWIPNYLRKLVSFFFEKYENQAVKKFSALVTATPHIKERFQKLNDCVINVNNYPILEELYDPYLIKDIQKEKSVIYIGGISKDRGSVNCVKSIANTDAVFKLAGKFANKREKAIVEELPGWEKVDYMGFLNRNQIKKELETSMAGLVVLEPKMNYKDSLPIKMFEYMATGLPVIASNFPLWKEIIEGNQCGLTVDPLNVNEISSAIQWVMNNPEKARAMGENGKSAVLSKFNWEAESKKLINLYEQLRSVKA
ncbi:Glycosyltransferase involved in cell wall bisynthesis [Gracilibacillus ureilyticus]|uniref:Glycosyltransferase involved in cell wall bisynthesis n=1 Tax=Gracilibacillus ureilyticus TaxID=531814 RepID=A0A1H9R952_9BACI|nr:glycosyltransferase family 4 protein [Gracilibacillus ureilyticus]SER69431.1 Glycosyltransferase involved in cell wall bisynthesis [Gracilibacillus ureilyticus]